MKDLRELSGFGTQLRAQMKAKEENRARLWSGRMALVKHARDLMKNRAYSEAAVAYEKYIKSLEIVFDVKAGGLLPEHFNSKARQSELTLLVSVYWDLVCIYDTSSRYGNRMMKSADKLAEFSRYTPIHGSVVKKAQNFLRKANNPQVIRRFLRNSALERPRCFIATAVFDDPNCAEVRALCALRDQRLRRSRWGRQFIYWYYRLSPSLARRLDGLPFLRSWLRPPLRLAARWARHWSSPPQH